jgi:hypothetical protein
MLFQEELKKALAEGKKNPINLKVNNKYMMAPKQYTLLDQIKGVKGAFSRVMESGVFNKETYTTEKQAIERLICCTTCTDKMTCRYCGCRIKAKRLLKTENCPNPITYPHLKEFPPKNFWNVINEKTSVIIAARNEIYLNKTIENLLEMATGEIEILVGLDGYDYNVLTDNRIKVFKEINPIGRREISNKLVKEATGKFLFEADAHIKMLTLGWDTRLKCICDENTIVGCVIDSINEENWESEGNRWIGNNVDKNLNWSFNLKENKEKVQESLSFFSCAWMIQKDTFWNYGGHKDYLGKFVNEDIEWTCNIQLTGGKIFIRTDVICSHLFRNEFPYKNNDDYLASKNVLLQMWNKNNNNLQIKTIEELLKDFEHKN